MTIRPEPGNSATIAAGKKLGLEISSFPLSEIRSLPWRMPPLERFSGILLGSANAIRHGGEAIQDCSGMPAYCVGELTAKAATEIGLDVRMTGSGGLQSVLDALSGEKLRLLRLAGTERMELAAPPGIEIETIEVYETEHFPLPARLQENLKNGALVLLHSAAAARQFAAECDRLDLNRSVISLAALGPRIAQAAGTGWARVQHAEIPREDSLLSLVRYMCQ